MKQQTAVQWLKERFDKYSDWVTGDHKATEYTLQQLSNDFNEALKMEKEQHGATWDTAIKAHDDRGYVHARSIPDFDEYYSETFENPNT